MRYMNVCITYVYKDVCMCVLMYVYMYVCMYVQYVLPFTNCKLSSQRFTTYHYYWDGCKMVWKAVGLRELPWDRLSTQKCPSSFQKRLEAISRVLLLRLIAVKNSQSCELETASLRSFSQFADYLSRAAIRLNFYGLASDWIFSSANLEKGSRVFDLMQCELTDVRSVQ